MGHQTPMQQPMQQPMQLPPPVILQGFKRGRSYYTLVVYPHVALVVKTSPNLRGVGAFLAILNASPRSIKMTRVAKEGPGALQREFGSAEVIEFAAVTHVQVRSRLSVQRELVFHLVNRPPLSLPFYGRWHSLNELWQVFGPIVGPRFVVDPDVAAQG
jgi:hypothetical protein